MRPVYLDHNATTPIAPEVQAAMAPYLRGQYGNPLTAHRFGDGPRAAVDSARDEVRALLGDRDRAFRVIFNSGATEGLNHAIKGLAFASLDGGRPGPRKRIVLGGIEHYAVKKPIAWLAETVGFEVITVEPDANGVVPTDEFLAAVDPDRTLLATLHWANNELGTIQPVEDIGAACRDRGVPFLCDGVQAIGKLDASRAVAFADLMALSAHKFYGPKGAGVLLVRGGVDIAPLLHGAQQENGLRGGTHNVAGIVGLGAAAERARTGRRGEAERLNTLRNDLWKRISTRIEGAHWNGKDAPLLPNTLNVSFEGCPSDELCAEMDRRMVAISAGAACLSGTVTPSANLMAMGAGESRACTSVRISLGHETSTHDISSAVEAFAAAVPAIRAAS